MITYEPFWHMLKASKETTYTLIYKHHISSYYRPSQKEQAVKYHHIE